MKENKKEEKFVIEGFIDDKKIFWKNHIPCICNGIHDLKHCKHCRYEHQENCVPRKAFDQYDREEDSKGKPTGKLIKRRITKIKVVRGTDGDLMAIEY